MSIGGSSKSSRQSSESQSTRFGFNQSSQALDQTQLGNQQQLLGQFNQQLDQFQGGPTQGIGQRGLAQLGRIGQGNTQGQQLALGQAQQGQQAGQQLLGAGAQGLQGLSQFANPNNPFLQSQISQLGSNLGDVFRQQLLPGIGSNFQQAGQRGSSRQGVAEGLAAQGIAQQFQQGSTALQSNAFNQAQQATGQLAQLGLGGAAQQGQLAQGAQGQFMQSQLGGAQGAVQGTQGLTQSQFQPFQVGAGIVGQPSVLGQSFGLDIASATSKSKGKSSGQSLAVGFT